MLNYLSAKSGEDQGASGIDRINPSVNQVVSDPYGIKDTVRLHHTRYEMNLHWYHLKFKTLKRGIPFTGIYYLCSNCHDTGDQVVNGACVNCHDVHGSNTLAGALYDELGYTRSTGAWGSYAQMATDRYIDSSDPFKVLKDLDSYPTYCVLNCHQVDDAIQPFNIYSSTTGTRAWYSPVME